MEESKLKWEPRISLGNILTIIVMLAGGAGVFARMEIGDARQDERITAMERRVSTLELSRESQAARLGQQLDEMNRRLATIEGFLRRSSPP